MPTVKQRAEAELQEHTAVEQIKQLSGKYSAIEFVRNDSAYRKREPRRWAQCQTNQPRVE